MNSEKYIYVDIFDIPDVMKVRTQYKIANEALYRLPIIKRDAVVKLAEEIQPFVYHREEMDRGTYERTITDTLFVIPPDCKRLAIPKKENEWIPVSERLPENLEVVNITYINREPATYYDHIKDKPMVATAVYYYKRFYWYSVACVDVLGEYGTDEWDEMDDRIKVTAWMELPKPYDPGVME